MPFDRSVLLRDLRALPASELKPVRRLDHVTDLVDVHHLGGVAAGAEESFARSDSTWPICPEPAPADTVVFEHATETGVQYWLPRYRIRSAAGVYEIAIESQDTDWAISIGLETVRAPELTEMAAGGQPLPHTPTISIRAGADIESRHDAVEVREDGRGLVAVFRLTLDERDELLRAFQSDTARARLVVARGVDVAVPAPATRGPVVLTLDHDVLVLQSLPARLVPLQVEPSSLAMERLARPDVGVRPRIGALDRLERVRPRFPRGFPRPLPLPLPFPLPLPLPSPLPVDDAPTPLPAPAEARFVHRSTVLDYAITLRFDPATHPYLFSTGTGGTATEKFERIVLRFPADDPNGTAYVYFQDRARPNTFRYLPDAFRLSRTSTAPFLPAVAFVVRQGTSEDTTTVRFSCYLRPATSAARLAAARRALAGLVPVRTGLDPEPVLEPLLARSSLRLALPGGVVSPVVDIDLANGFWLATELPMKDFQETFAVLAGAAENATTALRGTVTVSTGLAADDLVPVDLRYGRLAGEVFTATESWDEATSAMTVVATNATESTLRVAALPIWLRRDTTVTTASTDLTVPVDLAPGASFTVAATPTQPLAGPGPVDAVWDLDQVHTVLDPEVLLGLALDDAVDLDSRRPIMVMTTAGALAGGGDPGKVIEAIVVEFDGLRPVRLDATTPSLDVQVGVPLVEVLLRRDGGGSYRFRQTVVYAAQPPVEGAWRTTDRGVLVLPVS